MKGTTCMFVFRVADMIKLNASLIRSGYGDVR